MCFISFADKTVDKEGKKKLRRLLSCEGFTFFNLSGKYYNLLKINQADWGYIMNVHLGFIKGIILNVSNTFLSFLE